MRNLKRALSLALASVMVLGLMVVGSGASYADVTSEENQEAIEMLQAVGVMVGDDEGNFNPDKNVTRNEMAVVMSNLLDLKVEDFNAADIPFTDVPSWAVSYVAACYADGITSGTSATTYGGNNTVTAAQAALMMMKALGYFQYQGDFEQDWTLATIKKGSEIGIFDGITVDRVSPLTRNDVAQMALNALKLNMVTFTGEVGIEIPTANGNVVVGYNPEYTARTSANSKYNRIDVGTTDIASNNQYYVQLGEELYDGDLRLQNGSADVFGRPSRTWSLDGEEIGTYVNESLMVAEYTTAVTGKELYEDIGKTAFDKYDFEGYVDGKANDLYEEISRNNKDDVSETGNGALTQVFVDSDAELVVVTVVNTYLADAETDYNEKKEEVSFEVHGLGKILDVSAEDFYIEDVAEGDFVLVTYSYESEEIESISDVEILSDVTITKFTSNDKGDDHGTDVSSVTADGTKYDASNTLTYEAGTLENYTNSNLKDKTYNVYLDQYGYAIGVEEVEGADNYLFLTGINGGTDYLATANFDANVIFLDGTSEVVKVKSNDAIRDAISDAKTAGRSQALVNTWFKYTVNSNDVYTLTAIDSDLDGRKNSLAQNQTIADMDKDEWDVIDDRHISLVGGANERIYGTEDTVYLVAGLDTVSVDEGISSKTYGVIADADEVITGVDNVSIEVWDEDYVKDELTPAKGTAPDVVSHSTYALYDDSGVIIAAVVVGESAGTSSNVAYVISSKASEERFEDGEWGWTRDVVIDGQIVTLNEVNDEDESILADEMRQGQWYTVKYDADGNVKSIDEFDDPDEYVIDLDDAVTQLRKEDLVVMQIDNAVNYSKNGRTIYDWDAPDDDNGIFVDSDVQFVIRQENKNKTTTEEYTGWNQLKSALDTLNTTLDYEFNAVIENGRITSVVIIDRAGDGYIGPDNDHEGIYKVELDDPQYDAVVPYVIAGNWDEESAVDAIYQELIDQDYQVLDVIDNGRTYTFETKKGVVSRDFVWDVTYYENVYAVGDVISNGVSNDQGAEASVNTSYLVPGESITFTYDRDGNWQNSSYTVSFTVGGRTVSGVTLKIDGTVATATFTVPYNLTDGDVTLNTI